MGDGDGEAPKKDESKGDDAKAEASKADAPKAEKGAGGKTNLKLVKTKKNQFTMNRLLLMLMDIRPEALSAETIDNLKKVYALLVNIHANAVAERSADASIAQDSARNLDLLFKHINPELGLLKASVAVANRDMDGESINAELVSNSQKRLRSLFCSANRQITQLKEIANRNGVGEEELQPKDRPAGDAVRGPSSPHWEPSRH